MTWMAIVVALVVIFLGYRWATRGREAGDLEKSSNWGRGPSDGF